MPIIHSLPYGLRLVEVVDEPYLRYRRQAKTIGHLKSDILISGRFFIDDQKILFFYRMSKDFLPLQNLLLLQSRAQYIFDLPELCHPMDLFLEATVHSFQYFGFVSEKIQVPN